MQREGCARYARGGATNHAETQLPPSSNDACRNCSFQSPLCVTCPVKLSTIVVVRYAAFARIGFPFCKTVAILNVSTGAKIHGMSCIQANRFLENEMGVSLKGLFLTSSLPSPSHTLPISIHHIKHILSIIISHHSKPPLHSSYQTPPLHNHQSSQQTRL